MATINGTTNSEILAGLPDSDILRGLAGDDIILGFDGNDEISGNQNNDVLAGNLGNDTLLGGDGDDLLFGGKGNDRIFGDLGNDSLFGDLGVDTLTGGDGADIFFLRRNTGSVDVITDFTVGVDRLGVVEDLTSQELQFTQGTGTNANDTIVTDSKNGQVLAILQGVNSSQITGGSNPPGGNNSGDETTPSVPANFDENYYLVKNFDALSGLYNGQFKSAAEHYQKVGKAEGRAVAPARPSTFDIEFDYRFDTNGFFSDPARRATLEAAAKVWESVIQDEFPNVPAGTTFVLPSNPQTGASEKIVLNREIDDILIFVGAQNLGDAVGITYGTATGYTDDSFTQKVFPDRITGSNYEPYVASISFDTQSSFSIDPTPFVFDDFPSSGGNADVDADLFVTAAHEIGHVLGIGSSPRFENLVTGNVFNGPNTQALNPGVPVSLAADLGHLDENFATQDRVPALLGAGGQAGAYIPTKLDLAVLSDLGYQIA
jgi:RTX calcium-binding nonapeptide repeat (4 copies)